MKLLTIITTILATLLVLQGCNLKTLKGIIEDREAEEERRRQNPKPKTQNHHLL